MRTKMKVRIIPYFAKMLCLVRDRADLSFYFHFNRSLMRIMLNKRKI